MGLPSWPAPRKSFQYTALEIPLRSWPLKEAPKLSLKKLALVLEAVQPRVFIKRDSRGMAGGGFRGTGSFPKTVLGETDFSGFPSGCPLFMITEQKERTLNGNIQDFS